MTQHKDLPARTGAWAGIGFVLSAWCASFLYGQPPRIDSPSRVILDWARQYRATISVGMIGGVFASLLFLLFAAYMRRRLADAGEDFLASVAYGSGLLYAAFAGLSTLPWALIVMMDRQPGGITDTNMVRFLMDLGQLVYAPATGLIGLFFLTVGFAAIRAGIFSRWSGQLAMVMGVLCVVYIIPSMVNSGWHFGWGVLLYVSGPGLTVVVLIFCIQILRGPGQKAPPLPAEASATPVLGRGL